MISYRSASWMRLDIWTSRDEILRTSHLGSAAGKTFRCVLRSHSHIPTNRHLRRVCVGRHFAESTLFILCASVLSAFDIGPPVGDDGVPMEVKWEATDHLVVS